MEGEAQDINARELGVGGSYIERAQKRYKENFLRCLLLFSNLIPSVT